MPRVPATLQLPLRPVPTYHLPAGGSPGPVLPSLWAGRCSSPVWPHGGADPLSPPLPPPPAWASLLYPSCHGGPLGLWDLPLKPQAPWGRLQTRLCMCGLSRRVPPGAPLHLLRGRSPRSHLPPLPCGLRSTPQSHCRAVLLPSGCLFRRLWPHRGRGANRACSVSALTSAPGALPASPGSRELMVYPGALGMQPGSGPLDRRGSPSAGVSEGWRLWNWSSTQSLECQGGPGKPAK